MGALQGFAWSRKISSLDPCSHLGDYREPESCTMQALPGPPEFWGFVALGVWIYYTIKLGFLIGK